MRGTLHAAAVLILMAGTAGAAEPAKATSATQTQLLKLEGELNQAFLGGDKTKAAKILSEDWLLVTTTGKTKTRAEVLAEVGSPKLQFEVNQAESVTVRVWGDTAVLTGTLHQKYVFDGQPKDVRLQYTDTWVKKAGKWLQVSGHASGLQPVS